MENTKTYFPCQNDSMSQSQSSQVKSRGDVLDALLEKVRAQIELDCFAPRERALAEQIAMIIAEVSLIASNAPVRIDGADIEAWAVAMVYERLTHFDVEEVISRFTSASYEIRHIKTYLRTALYNAVLESQARLDNQVRADMIGGA